MKYWVVGFLIFLLSACAGTTTAVSKRNLTSQTTMSASVFLEPVPEDKQTLYLQVRNTSGNSALNIAEPLRTALQSKGYRIVSDPAKAHYMLQVNVLSIGPMNPETREQSLMAGFGGGLTGGAIGAGTGALISGHKDAVIGGALAGAAIGMLVDATVKDVTYSAIADLQISERTSAPVSSRSNTQLKQGTQTTVTVNSAQNSNLNRYQTRVISSANQVNLSIDKAAPVLAEGMTQSIAGIF